MSLIQIKNQVSWDRQLSFTDLVVSFERVFLVIKMKISFLTHENIMLHNDSVTKSEVNTAYVRKLLHRYNSYGFNELSINYDNNIDRHLTKKTS